MYWPDYTPQTERKHVWLVPTLLFGLLLGLLLGVIVNGWRNLNSAEMDESPLVVEATVIPSPQTERDLSPASPAMAPDFILPDLFDESLSRSLANYSGRAVILNFWASWCVP